MHDRLPLHDVWLDDRTLIFCVHITADVDYAILKLVSGRYYEHRQY